ncbi:nuclear GTPase SLIP-GC-like [Engraulis encrasicolus]|uniref:nuclear GTPase SLIP-GC-like n=1 Tax=Engraulis encrasicolus TaxID=184585 RepID=UPI002FD2F8AA
MAELNYSVDSLANTSMAIPHCSREDYMGNNSMAATQNLRLVLLGEDQKENARVGNFIVRRDAFQTDAVVSERQVCERVTDLVGSRQVIVINPPDLFRAEKTLLTARKKECMDLSAPGPHAFILVLRPENFLEEGRCKVESVLGELSNDALKYTILVTTELTTEHPASLFTGREHFSLQLSLENQSPLEIANQRDNLFEIVDQMRMRMTAVTPGTSLQAGGKHRQKRRREEDFSEEGESQKKKKEATEIIRQAQDVMEHVEHKLVTKLKDSSCTTLTNYIRTSLQDLQKPAQKTTVGVFGPTGCGKSSLLNAILGEPGLLPTGYGEACTSVIIQVEAKTEENFMATVEFISKEEWYNELKSLLEDAKDRSNDAFCRMAEDKIKALYGAGASNKSFDELTSGSNSHIEKLLSSGRKRFSPHSEAWALSKEIRPYISHGEDDIGKLYWPIVKAVKIEVPKNKDFPENVVLVDLPGNGDHNQTRDEMWKEMLRECTAVWIVSDINRAASDKVAWGILDTNMADMVPGGECTSIAFICTKTDDLHTQSYMREEELGEEDVQEEAQQPNIPKNLRQKRRCILHRNNKARAAVEKRAYENYDIQLKVFTVSSQQFLSEEYLHQEDTEILGLREVLKSFNDHNNRNVASKFFSRANGILHLIQARAMDEDRYKLLVELGATLERELGILRRHRLQSCYDKLEKQLTEGVQKAGDSCDKILEEQLTPPSGKVRGFHQTLSALCRNKGYFRSKDGETRDVNQALAEIVHQSINTEFNSLFPNQGETGQSVQEKINEFSICSINVNKGYSKPEAMDHILNFLKCEEAKLKGDAHKDIMKTKKAMYAVIRDTIKEKMTAGYIEAEKESGPGSVERKRKVLQEHVESVKYQMFSDAKNRTLSSFRELMARIQSDFKRKLRGAMDHALTEYQSTFSMDVQSEIEKMEQLEKEKKELFEQLSAE